jgi:hypothetical protein
MPATRVGIERRFALGPEVFILCGHRYSRPLSFADSPGPLGNAGPGSLYRGLRPFVYSEKPKRCSARLDNKDGHLLGGCR